MTANNFMNQINRDIEFGQEGKIPSVDLTGRMLRKLQRNGFVVYIKGSEIPKPGDEIVMSREESSFVYYKLKKVIEAEKLKNQRRIDEYG